MKITKYDEDEFALRLSREEAIKLLALFAACRSRAQLEDDGFNEDDVDAQTLFDTDVRIELFRALGLEGDEDDLDYYPTLRSPTEPWICFELYLRKDAAEKFLPVEEPA